MFAVSTTFNRSIGFFGLGLPVEVEIKLRGAHSWRAQVWSFAFRVVPIPPWLILRQSLFLLCTAANQSLN